MDLPLLLLGAGIALAALVAIVLVGRIRFDRHTHQIVSSLLAAAEGARPPAARRCDRGNLPAPVRRYLDHVLPEGRPLVKTIRLEQSGLFRSGDARSPWSSFAATQYVTTQPPGFVWDATIAMIPGLPVRVVDEYREGHGGLSAKLAGVVPVANATAGPALDEGELMRYLAEAPLYPTTLLPGLGVDWTPLDETSARASLRHGDTIASLVFHFNEKNEVDRVWGQRGFLTDDGSSEHRPWTGDWWNYQKRAGMLVPTDGKVAWIENDGEFSYWRGHVDSIEYQFEGSRATPPVPIDASRGPTSETVNAES